MDNKLEKRLQQNDINQTPKTILEELFVSLDNKRCNYEVYESDYRKKITDAENIIAELKITLKTSDELTVKTIKSISNGIKEQKAEIKKYKREIRLININCEILWKNELKIDKILDYGLE